MDQERKQTVTGKRPRPLGHRVVLPVLRAAGLVPWTIMYIVLFLVASVIVAMVEPDIHNIGDAAWLLFEVVTTIGLGDYTCVTVVGRFVAVILSIYSMFFLALLTGVVVGYCQERLKAARDESVAVFIHQLEHLPELSHEELVVLSEKVKNVTREKR